MTDFFSRVARWSADLLGSWQAFTIAVLGTAIWFVSGPLFGWSDTWQLVVNTITTVLTFLAVFLIQHAQNRDAKALQIKLDDLLVRLDQPDTRYAGIEQRSLAEMEDAELRIREEAERAASAEMPGSTREALGAEVTAVDDAPSSASGSRPSGAGGG